MAAMDFRQASDLFTRVQLSAPQAQRASLKKAAEIVQKEAKRVIGTYDYGWPPLKEETIARKGADTPLLESGELRDSIEKYIDYGAGQAYVGSNNPKATFHELGTSRIPARSFLAGAAQAKEHEVHELTKQHYRQLWLGKSHVADVYSRATSVAEHALNVAEGMSDIIEGATSLIERAGDIAEEYGGE